MWDRERHVEVVRACSEGLKMVGTNPFSSVPWSLVESSAVSFNQTGWKGRDGNWISELLLMSDRLFRWSW